jgi:hypothetical protein
MHKVRISIYFDITNRHESINKTMKAWIITDDEPTYIRVAPRPNLKEVRNVSPAYCTWRLQFVIWHCLLHETIMYVELEKKGLQNIWKNAKGSGRGLDLFIIFHLIMFFSGVVPCSIAVSKLLLGFELIILGVTLKNWGRRSSKNAASLWARTEFQF